jgi:hypothetical protein
MQKVIRSLSNHGVRPFYEFYAQPIVGISTVHFATEECFRRSELYVFRLKLGLEWSDGDDTTKCRKQLGRFGKEKSLGNFKVQFRGWCRPKRAA